MTEEDKPLTEEDKPFDLAAEIAKKIREDSNQPGTFRKHVFGTSGLTLLEEAIARDLRDLDISAEHARWIQSTPSLPEHKLMRMALEEKMAFNADLPLATRNYVLSFCRSLPTGIASEAKARLKALMAAMPLDRASKRIKNRSERLDKKLYEPKVRHRIQVHFGGWPRTSLCYNYIHAHKGRQPKRGNPWRRRH